VFFKDYNKNFGMTKVLSQHQKDYSTLFKVAIVGSSAVGKSCIINALLGNDFVILPNTLGIDFRKSDEYYMGVLYRIQVWDTAGQ
jgi:small GTP-binding protein